MKQNVLIFLISFLVAFVGGYLFFKETEPANSNNAKVEENVKSNDETNSVETDENNTENKESTISSNVDALEQNSCLTCHSIEAFGVKDAMTGPDLSQAYKNVEGKHGKTLEEFLKEPTSAVMSSVISSNPLTDEEREKIIEALKEASEK